MFFLSLVVNYEQPCTNTLVTHTYIHERLSKNRCSVSGGCYYCCMTLNEEKRSEKMFKNSARIYFLFLTIGDH